MPQHRDLDILCIGSRTAADDTENPPQDKERKRPHHHQGHPASPTSPLLRAAR
jgi:hypothetical protein